AIGVEVPTAHVWATDASEDALAVARANLAGIGSPAAVRVRITPGRWFDALPGAYRGQFDVIVSNPPYIAEDEVLPPEVVEWEPRPALFAGATSTEAVAEITAGSGQWLAPGGALVVEIAPHQAGEARRLAEDAGFADI